MSSRKGELDHEFLPFLRVYKDGHIERLLSTEFVPLSMDSHPTVLSKDVIINTETGLAARLYMRKTTSADRKLPLLIYVHGGGFLVESAFSVLYHSYLNSVVAEANVIAVSVEYRLAPEHHLPIAYDDCKEAIEWVASHSKGDGKEAWLRDHADFDKVFIAGDSAGANIVHNMAMRGMILKFKGIVLVHCYFLGEQMVGSERSDPDKTAMLEKLWIYACPSTTGNDDPRINPVAVGAPSLSNLGCSKALIFVAEKEVLRDRAWVYYEALKKSGWGGTVEIVETEGEDHVFHLFNPTCDKAIRIMKKLASFLNQEL